MVNDVEGAVSSDGVRDSVHRAAGRGFRWTLFGMAGARLGTFLMGLVLARLLVPADFGVYAVALGAMALLMSINDVGIIAATVQWHGDIKEMAPTATVLALASSGLIFAVFWVLAPSYAAFCGVPEAVPVVRLLATVVLLDGLVAVRVGALLRAFRQDIVTVANLVAMVVQAAVSIPLAMQGTGAYSLAIGNLSGQLIINALMMWYAPLRFEVGLDLGIARRLLRFGLPLAACFGVEAFLLNVDYVVVGEALGPTQLGFYMLAFNISSWVIGVLGNAVRTVAVPSFSRLAEHPDTLAPSVQRALTMLITVALPICIPMATLAAPIVAFLYGDQWGPTAQVLRFLAVLSIVRVVTQLVIDVVTGTASTMAAMWLNLAWAVALVPALVIGTRMDGIRGTALAHVVVALLVAVPLAIVTVRRCGVELGPIGRSLLRPFAAATGCIVVSLVLEKIITATPFVELSTAGSAAFLTYVLIVTPWAVLVQWVGRVRAFAEGCLSRQAV